MDSKQIEAGREYVRVVNGNRVETARCVVVGTTQRTITYVTLTGPRSTDKYMSVSDFCKYWEPL